MRSFHYDPIGSARRTRKEAARSWAFPTHRVVGIGNRTRRERQATTTNALRKVFAKADELVDRFIESMLPTRREFVPIFMGWSPTRRQRIKRFANVSERNPNSLRRPYERDTPKRVASIPALIPFGASASDQSLRFVEVHRRYRDSAAIRDLSDRKFTERRLCSCHSSKLTLDLNNG